MDWFSSCYYGFLFDKVDMRKLTFEDFEVTGMSESAKIILINHINSINLLIDKHNKFPSKTDLIDIKSLIPHCWNFFDEND